MCRYHSQRFERRRMRDAESFFVVVLAMIRKALAILSQARRDLEEIANAHMRAAAPGTDIKPGFARSAQTHTETHLNVPL